MSDVLKWIFAVLPFAMLAVFAFHLFRGFDRWSKKASDPSYWTRVMVRWSSPLRALILAVGIAIVVLLITKRFFGAFLLLVPLVWFGRPRLRARPCPMCGAPVETRDDRCGRCGAPVARPS